MPGVPGDVSELRKLHTLCFVHSPRGTALEFIPSALMTGVTYKPLDNLVATGT